MKIQTVKFPLYATSPHRTIEVKGRYVWNGVRNQESSDTVKIVRNFGVQDNKGRAVGAFVKTFTEVYRDATPEETAKGERDNYYGADYIRLFRVPVGTYYCFTPCATRAGESFGAGMGSNTYATEADRDAAVAEYFKNAQKRATKAWAKMADEALDAIVAGKY